MTDRWVHLDLWACLVPEVRWEKRENVDLLVNWDPLDRLVHLVSLPAMMLQLCLLSSVKAPPRALIP